MAFIKCPKCDINYVADKEKLCNLCENVVASLPIKLNQTAGNTKKSSRRKKGETCYFLKPLGYSGTPYSGDGFPQIQNFAREPKSVSTGDILISYSVSNGRLVGYYEVVTEPYEDKTYTRWSWGVETNNLSLKYTTKWGQKDLYLSVVTNQYLRERPNEFLTNVGGLTLGALNFGADKIRLTESFAKYLMERMDNY